MTASTLPSGARLGIERLERVRALIYEANLLLDEGRYAEWIALCDPDFSYRVTAYSPEIRKWQIWLDHDRAGIENLVDLLPRHQSDRSRLTRHTTVYRVAPTADDAVVEAISSVLVHRTTVDGGETQLFAVGTYHDRLRLHGEHVGFAARELRLETRQLGIGTHYPL